MALGERVGNARRSGATVDERKGTKRFAIWEIKRNIDEEMVWMVRVSMRGKNEKRSDVVLRGYIMSIR